MAYLFLSGVVIAVYTQAALVHASTPTNELTVLREMRFIGSCDASGAVAISDKLFAVADDEDNVIRVYDADLGGLPLLQHDLSYDNSLKPVRDAYGRPTTPAPLSEMDIEAATEIGGQAYWITSHGRDKMGRPAPERLRFFATPIDFIGAKISLTAPAVTDLLSALLHEPSLKPFNLDQAATKPPKAPGGLNLEGMTGMPGDRLLLGFRNPLPANRALLLILRNPTSILQGAKPELERPILLDLAGRGVRGLSYWQGQYWLAAGDFAETPNPALYRWPGPGSLPMEMGIDLPSEFNIEAFYTPDSRLDFMLLSDDGNMNIDGKPCKKLKDAKQKFFRGLWVKPKLNDALKQSKRKI